MVSNNPFHITRSIKPYTYVWRGSRLNMSNYDTIRHAVITPSRDEEHFLPRLIKSVSTQTILPHKWIIVNHNSTEDSINILQNAKNEFSWIDFINVNDNENRKRGSLIASLVNKGISEIDFDWDYISKIDADMVLPEDYFENIFNQFKSNEKLGIASGSCFLIERRRKIIEKVSSDHTRGGLKTYRKSCFHQIGGISEVDGWDGIDNIMAQMNGWVTYSFPSIEVLHQRRTGSSMGLNKGCFEAGKFAHTMRYHPLFIIARSIHRMPRKPIFFGGVSMFIGYLYGIIIRQPPIPNSEVISFLRKKQKNRLLFLKDEK